MNWYKVIHLHMMCFQGCYEKVEEWLDDNKHLLGTIAMCVLVIQVSCLSDHWDLFNAQYFISHTAQKYSSSRCERMVLIVSHL